MSRLLSSSWSTLGWRGSIQIGVSRTPASSKTWGPKRAWYQHISAWQKHVVTPPQVRRTSENTFDATRTLRTISRSCIIVPIASSRVLRVKNFLITTLNVTITTDSSADTAFTAALTPTRVGSIASLSMRIYLGLCTSVLWSWCQIPRRQNWD